jgi:Ca2+-binding RTX toxin-like protein
MSGRLAFRKDCILAISVQGPTVWFTNNAQLDYRTFDLEELANGQILVAFGGSSSVNAALHTSLLDLTTGLGPITTLTWAPTAFSSTVRRIDITPGNGDNALITLHSTTSSAGGVDTNFSLVTLPSDGGAPLNVNPLPVNPGGAAENTHDKFATLHLATGGYVVFFSEPGTKSFSDLSNGIRMARFSEAGVQVGTTKTVIGEKLVNELANIENNPEQPSAVALGNGNIGLFYKESNSLGQTRFLFQELTADGARVGRPNIVVEGAISPKIERLDNGNLLASWFDVVAGQHKARLLDADGDPLGRAFGVSDSGMAPFSSGEVVAIKGGFASAWLDTVTGLWMAQHFGADGTAKSNPFLILDTAGDFTSATAGIERVGDGFIGHIMGVKTGTFIAVLEGQVYSAASSIGIVRKGLDSSETLNGGNLDDRLDLGGGNDVSNAGSGTDIVLGGRGNDRIAGGAGFDRLDGGFGNDRLDGGAGLDFLIGGDGNDDLKGGDGSDRLNGGLGLDTFTGGAGADIFIFTGRSDAMTTITDFSAAEGDKLKILASVFGYLGVFTPALGTDPNPTVSGLYFNTATHILSHDTDGAGTLYERVNVAFLPGVTTLSLFDLLTF